MQAFHIPDMSCAHCASTIRQTLQAADPHARIEIDLTAHLLKIDSQLGLTQISNLLEEAGYTPQLQS